MTFTIELSYPSPLLSPNARVHWRKVNDAKQAQRNEAWAHVVATLAGKRRWIVASAHLTFTFYPPDKRQRDLDNAFASCKSARDGIADALGVNDSTFTFTLNPMGEPRKGGAVSVKVEAR